MLFSSGCSQMSVQELCRLLSQGCSYLLAVQMLGQMLSLLVTCGARQHLPVLWGCQLAGWLWGCSLCLGRMGGLRVMVPGCGGLLEIPLWPVEPGLVRAAPHGAWQTAASSVCHSCEAVRAVPALTMSSPIRWPWALSHSCNPLASFHLAGAGQG